MGVFEHFPYTNFHDLNLDKILERTQAAEEAVETSAQQVQDAAADMAAAQAAAANAVTTANNAVTTANNAATTANNAMAATVHYYEFSVNSSGTLSAVGNSLVADKQTMIDDFTAGRGIMKIVDARHNKTAMVTPTISGQLAIYPATDDPDIITLNAFYQTASNLICSAQATINSPNDTITGGPVMEIVL